MTLLDFDQVVAEFMKDFGFTATYTHIVSSLPNDVTNTIVTVKEDILIEAIKMELIRPQEGAGNKSGTLIEQAELMLYVRPAEKADIFAAALSIRTSSDYLTINNAQWRIVTSKEYNPTASNCILYELYIKK